MREMRMKKAERGFTICAVATGITTGFAGGLATLSVVLRNETILYITQLFASASLAFSLGLVYWGWRLWKGI